ncbi:MAG: hypothetical protein LBQ00_08270 [Syntrophobacterales bacterium]|jgi:hypothetical protein|nr:hypothetical protein [Syntrophobacterales bacterium]
MIELCQFQKVKNINRRSTRLKASVDHEHGIRSVDLFVDHTTENRDISIVNGNGPVSMDDHLKLILTPFSCPNCQSQRVTSDCGWSLKQWVLKFTGRKIFLCGDCGSIQMIKVHRCEWEVIGTTIAITLALLALSIHWTFR